MIMNNDDAQNCVINIDVLYTQLRIATKINLQKYSIDCFSVRINEHAENDRLVKTCSNK